MAADSASALWCSKRLFDNSAPPLTDRGCEGLPSHDCERIKQHQKRESRGDRVLHDPALGLLSSQVQDRAIGLRPLSLIGLLVARSHPPPPHDKPPRLLLPSLTDLVSTYQAMQSSSYRQREDAPFRTPEAVPQNVLSRRACLECHRQKQKV